MTDINFKVDGNWTNAALAIYKVGAIYMSVDSTSPATLFGGTWVALEGRMLIGTDSTYAAGTTGGAATVTLTAAQSGVPEHTHGYTAPANHSHGLGAGFACGYTTVGSGGGTYVSFRHKGTGGWDTTFTHKTSSGGDEIKTRYNGIELGGTTDFGGGSTGATTSNNTAANAIESHNNMPPYLAVYMWKRTA